jgi:hypothetical protein
MRASGVFQIQRGKWMRGKGDKILGFFVTDDLWPPMNADKRR